MIFTIGINPKTSTLVGVICVLGYVLYKKETENKALKSQIGSVNKTEG